MMPNISSGILYVASKNPQNIAAFVSHGLSEGLLPEGVLPPNQRYYRTTLSYYQDADSMSDCIEYLGDGKYIGRFYIECAWSCLGCIDSDQLELNQLGGRVTSMDLKARQLNVGFLILAEENSFAEIIKGNNLGIITSEQPDIWYMEKEHDEDEYCEVKFSYFDDGWYILNNGELHKDEHGITVIYDTDEAAIADAVALGATPL